MKLISLEMSETPSETVRARVDRVLFRATDSTFAVLLTTDFEGHPRTLAGELGDVSEGERLEVTGTSIDHPRFGPQINVATMTILEPDDRDSRIAFLRSIKGIGETRAETLVDTLGPTVLERIDADPNGVFRTLEGVGEKTATKAAESWRNRRGVREVMTLLADAGIKDAQRVATRAVSRWESDTVERLENDPYELCDLSGVNFPVADQLGRHLGVPAASRRRVETAAIYVLQEAEIRQSHVYLPAPELELRLLELLNLSTGDFVLQDCLLETHLVRVDGDRVYRTNAYRAETTLAADITLFAETTNRLADVSDDELDPSLTDDQRGVVRAAFARPIVAVTGPPGVGKTTVISEVVATAKRHGVTVALTAPTGRAARRMTQLTNHPATTVHRLLGIVGKGQPPERSAADPIPAQLVILDEASMLDVDLAAMLTDAIAPGTHIVLVGDPDQLPPPGIGEAFAEVLGAPGISHHRLTQVFRQAAHSKLLKAAARIRVGKLPRFETEEGDRCDLTFDWITSGNDALDATVRAATTDLPDRLGIDASDLQVIAPMYKGPAGIDELNGKLRDHLNPNGDPVLGGRLRRGDVLIQTKTDYSLVTDQGDPFVNGAFCRLDDLREGENPCLIATDENGGAMEIPTDRASTLKLGYAISVHKSQGSEWPVTVVVLPPAERSRFLNRRLLRTALTRARRHCHVVAHPATFAAAVGRADTSDRFCALSERIEDAYEASVLRELEAFSAT